MTDSTTPTPTCLRCGNTLPTTRVRVPVYKWIINEVTREPEKVWDCYTWEDEIGDCARCTGGF